MIAPDYSLSGKITQRIVRAGRTKQSDYRFQLSLTDLRTGLAFWEDEHVIVKQGKRASVGF
jgi:PBP1b-binding outer membrane lipoprotein LpoB